MRLACSLIGLPPCVSSSIEFLCISRTMPEDVIFPPETAVNGSQCCTDWSKSTTRIRRKQIEKRKKKGICSRWILRVSNTESKSVIAQNQILDGFDSMDEAAFNQRTNLNLRRKRILQCCTVSKRRESEAIDLILSKVEMDFVLNLIKLSDPEPRLYTLDSCIEVFNENFVKNCPYYIQLQMNKKVRYAKGCHQILPENQRVGICLLNCDG